MTTQDMGYGITAYAKKAKSAFYSDTSPDRVLTTHLAWRTFARRAPDAASIWLKQLRSIDAEAVQAILSKIPSDRLTDVGREFTARLLWVNRSLLLDGA